VRAYTRRQLVQGAGAVGLGLLAGCGRVPGQTPEPAPVRRIGWLSLRPAAGSLRLLEAFRQGLQELGYIESKHILIEPRYADGHTTRLPALAAELVQHPVDVLLAEGVTALAAQDVTRTLPIVMVYSRDPVADGLVASLARPGGNVTGLGVFNRQLAPKRLELLRETLPGLSRVAYLWDRVGRPEVVTALEAVEGPAQALGLHLLSLELREPGDLDAAIQAASREGAEALSVAGALAGDRRVIALAAQHRLPAIYPAAALVRDGGLMSYAPNDDALYQRAAYYVDRILKGSPPADLPVEQPMRFDFVINLRTAQTLGLTLPPHVLLQATEVIQ
jgi:putative tryptophan/tyrosine transport system substrate-binding protein